MSKQGGFDSLSPLGDLPRSRSGRVPKRVVDEAQGGARQHAEPGRAYSSPQPEQSQRRRRRQWSRGSISALVVMVTIGAVTWMAAGGPLKLGGGNFLISRPANWPTPSHEESAHPLGVPAPVVAVSDSYQFVAHQDDGTTPVAYDPCRPIHYVIRAQGEVAGGRQIVTDAVSRVSQATGLRFVYDGLTTEGPSRQRPAYQPKRYGDRWAPVLISWVTPADNLDFAAADVKDDATDYMVLGEGGSLSAGLPNQSRAKVTGMVMLNVRQLKNALQRPRGNKIVRAVVLHELAHLVGLNHVSSLSNLMNTEMQPGVIDFGAGDLTGLAALGRGTCLPDL